MNRFSPSLSILVLPLLLDIGGAACTPATTYNRGVEVEYHPSAKAEAAARLVPSAIELRSDDDEAVIRSAGGVYLGDLEVTGLRAGVAAEANGGGAATLAGRVSLEAASRGATHFHAVSSSITHGFGARRPSRTDVRFVLYRVEPDAWGELPTPLKPAA